MYHFNAIAHADFLYRLAARCGNTAVAAAYHHHADAVMFFALRSADIAYEEEEYEAI